jgi:tetratricopeptide (TPR) repeat protein
MSLQNQAETFLYEAHMHERDGNTREFLRALHSAVLLYAAADAERENPEEPSELTRSRADACRRYAEALAADGQHAEAANIFQEATDLYGLLEGSEAQQLAGESARSLLASLAALRAQPSDRLQLLIAHHERIQQQLALTAGTEKEQAACAMHIARIYQRRDRPAESAQRYREALELLNGIDSDPESELTRAECHHRLGTLFAERLREPYEAIRHYRAALDLYHTHEPPVYGVQSSYEFCRSALSRLTAAPVGSDQGSNHRRSQD